jgi:hypothetical protein
MSRRLDRQRELAAKAKPKAQAEAVDKPTGPPLTTDVGQAMYRLQPLKIKLAKQLRARTGEQIIVQLELDDQGWYFLIRGCPPLFTHYQGTRCQWAVGVLVGSAPNQG